MTSQTFSQSQAAKIAGVARNTIGNHMKSGKLSYTINSQGHKVLEASELIRVYGKSCNFDIEPKNQIKTETISIEEKDNSDLLFAQKEIEHLKAMNAKLEDDIEYFRRQEEIRTSESAQYRAFLTDQREQSTQFERQLSKLLKKQDDMQQQINQKPKGFFAKLFRG